MYQILYQHTCAFWCAPWCPGKKVATASMRTEIRTTESQAVGLAMDQYVCNLLIFVCALCASVNNTNSDSVWGVRGAQTNYEIAYRDQDDGVAGGRLGDGSTLLLCSAVGSIRTLQNDIFSIPSRSLRSLGSRERNDKENRGPAPAATMSSNISYLTTTFEVIADASPEVYGEHEIEDEGALFSNIINNRK